MERQLNNTHFTQYLDGLGSLHRLFGGDTRFPLSQQLLDEVGDVPTGNGDVLDAASYHIALRLHSSVERMRGGGVKGLLVVVVVVVVDVCECGYQEVVLHSLINGSVLLQLSCKL